MSDIRREVESTKSNVISTINKKADFALLEKVREQTMKLVDMEYMQSQIIKAKQDMQGSVELAINEANISQRTEQNEKFEERTKKAENNA